VGRIGITAADVRMRFLIAIERFLFLSLSLTLRRRLAID
jgi:hypothetical protein